jgi:pimeloyl-ACP methyl ester carboxylesterase
MKKWLVVTMIISTMLVGCNNPASTSANANNENKDKNISTTDFSGKTSENENDKTANKDIDFECKSNDLTIRGSIRLPSDFDKNNSKKYPVIIMSHGILGDRNQGELFSGLADKLEDKGVVTVRFDFDGYGNSDGKLVDNSIKTEVNDLKSVIQYVKTLDYIDTKQLNLVGFSMGGAATSIVAGELKDEIANVVLWAPAAVLVDDCAAGRLMDATVDVNNLPDEIPVMGGQFTFGKAFFKDAIGLDIYGEAKQYTGPVLILQGNADKIVPMSYSEKYNQNYANSKLVVIDKGEHVFSGDPLKQVIKLTVDFFNEKITR